MRPRRVRAERIRNDKLILKLFYDNIEVFWDSMKHARDVLNEIKWRDGLTLERVQIYYRDRMVKDYKVLVGAEIASWDKSFIYTKKDSAIPFHRVERIVQTANHDLASGEIYRDELLAAGFQKIEFLGDFQGGEFTEDAPYLILVCRK